MGFCDNTHNFMTYKYNLDFLRRNAADSLSAIFPVADRINLSCKGLSLKPIYNTDRTITLEIVSDQDTELEIGLFSLLERVSLEKISIQKDTKVYHQVEISLRQKGIGFVHVRDADGCRTTKQIFIH